MDIAEEQKEKKNQFSPLQTGCAFVMLTNMLIYLAVVAFVFNLLDPSKLDSSYLTKREFTAKEESEKDKEYRALTRKKKKETRQVQEERLTTSSRPYKQESSSASKLSELSDRNLASSVPRQNPPSAALTHSRPGGYGSSKSIPARRYLFLIYPRIKVTQSHSFPKMPGTKTITPENYDTVAVELAPKIDYPIFRIPSAKSLNSPVYSPPNPISPPFRGAHKINSPSRGAEAIPTNQAGTAEKKEKTTP
ncbi:hypothetical protein [Tichowtungia aerotolerans]|uniref:Uncharacterized protein n=1 Tax=Tichowtungia aerotolerans TaxID=2697043 RepID=A0A6P1M2Y5_9BACT|nr:hypothetical protein [Tichowtungia aerotolerans]QHI68452.1 hypothetical protein GT409_02950 [Tichowtungia aerotolerans]